MPKISQLSEKYATESLLREIRTQQGSVDLMNTRALADAAGIPYQTLLRRMKSPNDFTLGELKSLVKVVPLHPLALLSFLGYSNKDLKKLMEPVNIINPGSP